MTVILFSQHEKSRPNVNLSPLARRPSDSGVCEADAETD
jgi:hypothetical protein